MEAKRNDFGAVISIIENAKGRALKAINTELINMGKTGDEKFVSPLVTQIS